MGSNPSSEPNGWTNANVFDILFDATNTGTLKTPEAGSGSGVNIDVPQQTLVGGSYSDMMWGYDSDTYKHMVWMPAENYLAGKGGHRVWSMEAITGEYDNSTGTVTMLFARCLSRPESVDFNALQMRPGERWVMGFLLELEFQGNALDYRVDGWPRTTFGVWSNDSSWWPKLAIDLSNPPAAYPSTTAQAIEPQVWDTTLASR